MFRALALSLAQLGDPPILRVFAKSMALTLALFAVLGLGLWYGVRGPIEDLIGERADTLAGAVAVAIDAVALWLLFRAVAIPVIGIFADEVVAAVEARHYPDALATARPVSKPRAAWMGLGSGLRALLVNLVLLPVYLALLVTGVGTAIAFIVVNGWLLGRDLGDMVAARHLSGAALRGWRRSSRGGRFLIGVADAALFVVPLANLVAPVLGAAMMTHIFHRRRT
ncbi:EI24 domain-containing protein [Sphingomonas sp. CROZ-RG-20F-R02-07]|uniref:EI24 domain-containing protein n=1 Tax=Sphingomonas sp. CROZ-RG-20F-R02-07 TaxID=2914832 RepID=UPI001F579DAB|nr:EI24 domain-containing protein [Sphingomonas sp. CROZ-RG-20F-R02-07]